MPCPSPSGTPSYSLSTGPNPALFYGVDQIGSVRRVFESSTSAPAYDHDPYGVALQGTLALTDFGYAGMFSHSASAIMLTWFRGYSADTGRWLSRDPLEERGDSAENLYSYVLLDPLNKVDPLGLTYQARMQIAVPVPHMG